MIRIGITGTDTAVGKTVIGCALLALMHERGIQATPMKPCETGISTVDEELATSDGARLRVAAQCSAPMRDIVPYPLAEPLAPMVAAARAGISIDARALDTVYARLTLSHDAIVVEGAGGLLVPIAPGLDFGALFKRWSLPIIVVAANRLGVINHTLLTVQAAERAGLMVKGVVLNHNKRRGNGGAFDVAEHTNFAALTALLPGMTVLTFPFVEHADDFVALAGIAQTTGLGALAGVS